MSDVREDDGLEAVAEKWRRRWKAIRNPRNWWPLILAGVVWFVGWASSDGNVRKIVEPHLKISCFDAKDYPLGKWTYQAKIRVGHADYILDHYWILKTPSEGHTQSDYCGRGKVRMTGEFSENEPIRYEYTDKCGYCSVGYLDFSDDGCEMSGRVYGFENGCPATFPSIEGLPDARKINATFRWANRPYVWEYWNHR